MSPHPRARRNLTATLIGLGCGGAAAAFGYLHPENWRLWGGFLIGCAFFTQLDGLVQFMAALTNGIRAWKGGPS